ncbi:MAG TPA: hypothetical protein VE913_06840 [Longimicrobium sp.]|nr:hypothetical protein [Longimicrobium sp.]
MAGIEERAARRRERRVKRPDDGLAHGRAAQPPARSSTGRHAAVRRTVLRCAAALLLAACDREKSGSSQGGEDAEHIATLADGASFERLADVERVGARIDAKNDSTALEKGGFEEVADSGGAGEPADSAGVAEVADGGSSLKSPSSSRPLGRYPALGQSNIACRDLGYAVRVEGADPYNLDSDDDGIGCELHRRKPIPDSARI